MNFILSLIQGESLTSRRGLERATRFFDLSSTVQAPTPRNITNEMLQTISGFEQTAPRQLALNQTYDPAYAALGLDTQRQNLYGFDDADGTHHPGTLEMGRTSTQFQRAGDIADIAQLGPAAQAAFLAANPDLAYGIGQLRGRMSDSPLLQDITAQGRRALGPQDPNGLLGTLNRQAAEGLASGGQLSPQEARALAQQSAAGFADRGNYRGNQSLGAELLSRDAAVRQRQQQAQQLASGVQNLNLQDAAQRQQFALSAQGAGQNQNDFVGRGTQIFGNALSDPFMAVLGRSSGAGGGGGGSLGQTPIGANTKLYDPLNAYASDVYNTNYNAQASANIANANNQSATNNALLTAGVGLLGAFLSDERLKKNVKKTGRKTKDGIPEKTWTYKTDKTKRTYTGVVAQDVEKVRPDAVIEDPISGVKAVDYGKLDTPFFEERQMLAA